MPFFNPPFIISILIAISIHEWAHAFAANKLGDPTAEHSGRLTLNPIAHIDLIGALMFLIVGFGWAKPVPVDPSYFRNPRRDMSITALAGPFSNLVLAVIAFTILSALGIEASSIFDLLSEPSTGSAGMQVLERILKSSQFVNLALMAFNLFPVAPLDGSNIVRMFIPYQYVHRYEDFLRIGPFILLFLIIFERMLPIPILSGWVYGIMNGVLAVFGAVVPF